MTTNTSPKNWHDLTVSSARYHVLEKLGAGGMAYVYRAYDRNLDSDVVLKVPRLAMLEDETFVKRFRAEIRSLVKLRHPHIVSVLDVGEHEGVPFAVLQYLSGGTLLDLCAKKSTGDNLSLLQRWLPPIAQAIDFLHMQGFIHRDIKPENILFDEHGHAYLADFGVIKTVLESEEQSQSQNLTRTGVLGTPEYMAPEMILGRPFDGRIDQYALGITLYEMFAKRRPFEGKTGTAVLVAQTREEPPFLGTLAPKLPEQLVQAIHRCLNKDPNQRFPSCGQLADTILATIGDFDTDPTSTSLLCPSCGGRLKVPRRAAGKNGTCPACESRFTVSIDLTKLAAIRLDSGEATSDAESKPHTPQATQRNFPPDKSESRTRTNSLASPYANTKPETLEKNLETSPIVEAEVASAKQALRSTDTQSIGDTEILEAELVSQDLDFARVYAWACEFASNLLNEVLAIEAKIRQQLGVGRGTIVAALSVAGFLFLVTVGGLFVRQQNIAHEKEIARIKLEARSPRSRAPRNSKGGA